MNDEIKALMPKKPYLDDFKIYPANGSGKVLVAYTDVYDYYDREIVALFENARVVYGKSLKPSALFNAELADDDTHTALLIGIKPLDQAVTKDEIVRTFKNVKLMGEIEAACFIDRIERFGLKP